MESRYSKIVLEAEEGVIFKTSMGTKGEIIIKASKETKSDLMKDLLALSAGECAHGLSVYTDKFNCKAIIPSGWTVSGLQEENTIWGQNVGLVIYEIPDEKVSSIDWEDLGEVEGLRRTYNQLVWCPVNLLTASSTIDGILFNEQFGRTNHLNDDFSEEKFHEGLHQELAMQLESIRKYGGFWSTRYRISKDPRKGTLRSVKCECPLIGVDFVYAKNIASMMFKSGQTTAHLMHGAEYDTIEKWQIETETQILWETECSSTNEQENRGAKSIPRVAIAKGHSTNVSVYSFRENIKEWTQEQYSNSYRVIRAGNTKLEGFDYTISRRIACDAYCKYMNAGFRVAICIR